ncbi:type II toxin-antitoxin system YafQ family toxin [bacterium]|nr:type II toxin-antitoxin system YafQ family toxin [bacterium]
MLEVRYSKKFSKDQKLIAKRGYNIQKLKDVIALLRTDKPLPPKYKDHALSGNYITYRECHIEPDWLLVYKIENDTLTLVLSRTGTHSDLFN